MVLNARCWNVHIKDFMQRDDERKKVSTDLSSLIPQTMPSTSTECSSLSCRMPILMATKQPVLPMPALQHHTSTLHKMLMLSKQPILPVPARQHSYFTWCLCSQNSLYCQHMHYNAITSNDVYAHKTAHTANASTTMQLFLMTFMLFKKTARSANASTTIQLLHMMFIF